LCEPQAPHTAASAEPQSPQNRFSAGFSPPHAGQITTEA
jgi:hypothetical protein